MGRRQHLQKQRSPTNDLLTPSLHSHNESGNKSPHQTPGQQEPVPKSRETPLKVGRHWTPQSVNQHTLWKSVYLKTKISNPVTNYCLPHNSDCSPSGCLSDLDKPPCYLTALEQNHQYSFCKSTGSRIKLTLTTLPWHHPPTPPPR